MSCGGDQAPIHNRFGSLVILGRAKRTIAPTSVEPLPAWLQTFNPDDFEQEVPDTDAHQDRNMSTEHVDDNDPIEVLLPASLRAPKPPSEEKREHHELTHLPFCKFVPRAENCVQ